ncbi:glucosamine-6-phosphate deaminase [Thalassotalea maritima]|uniref:glucosamine-6-phosphate deaminase n=1 Tax=Thalassotalea maritima TaxID=3242416 RepID=UPI003528E565
MQIIICEDANSVALEAAQWITSLIQQRPNAVLGLATGSTVLPLYEQLTKYHQENKLSFKGVTTFNLDEYHQIHETNPQSYRSFMNAQLFDHIDIDIGNTHLPTCTDQQNPREQGLAYELAIEHAGGIDLQILGIGANGHIGFNEPGSSLASRTRIKTLTQQTLKDNSRLFNKGEVQPTMAMTMGIQTIMDARYVLLMATGANKAKAVNEMITGAVSANCPATMLQMHENAVVIIDNDAASELSEQNYFKWTAEKNRLLIEEFGYFHKL